MEELDDLRDTVAKFIANQTLSRTSDLWIGGSYNSAERKYQWTGSGVNADTPQMFTHYPPHLNNNFKLYYSKTSKKISYTVKTVRFKKSLCEEYPSSAPPRPVHSVFTLTRWSGVWWSAAAMSCECSGRLARIDTAEKEAALLDQM